MEPVIDIHHLRYSPDGDAAVRVEFGHVIDPRVNRRVHGFCAALADADIDGVIEFVPAYAVATVYYDPGEIEYDVLVDRLRELVHETFIANISLGLTMIRATNITMPSAG